MRVPSERDLARGDVRAWASPSTVLFLAANPAKVQLLQLGEECRAIEDKIRAAKFRDQIRFQSWWAARPDDLLQALNEHTPSVLHFSGHGDGDQGLCFQSEDGSAQHVSAEGLAQVMRAAGASVMVVVLNACYSEVQAQALVAHVPCVVGMPHAIGDEAAITYAASFYGALAFGRSVANAHQQGLAALALNPSSGVTRDVENLTATPRAPAPTLLTRPDIDPDHIFIVQGSEEPAESHPSPAIEVPALDSRITKTRHREWRICKLLLIVLFLLTSAVAIKLLLPWRNRPSLVPESFGLAVRLHGPAGLFDKVCTRGTITLDIGTARRAEQISSEGVAYFSEIPRTFANQTVPVDVICDGYKPDGASARITLVPDQTCYVSMQRQCNEHDCHPDADGVRGAAKVGAVADAAVAEAAVADAAAEHAPVRYRGPCTQTPSGAILHSASDSCPRLKPDEPDVRAIMHDAKQKGYTCTEIYRCK
ncbi:MAG TPA: CHAT domain-containing protein [Kofleriaceae bacterium]|nr:CHAT domain-containing protein [Kofleriaceae bacterium]